MSKKCGVKQMTFDRYITDIMIRYAEAVYPELRYSPLQPRNAKGMWCKEGVGGSTNSSESIDKSENSGIMISDKQFGKKIGKHTKDYGLNPNNPDHREQMLNIINDIFSNYTEHRVGNFCGQDGNVDFYIKGNDVLLCKPNNEFITIMKGGIDNDWVKNARKK